MIICTRELPHGPPASPALRSGDDGDGPVIVVASVAGRVAATEERVLPEQPDPDRSAAEPTPVALPTRRPRVALLAALALGVYALDLATKLIVVATVEPGEDIRLLGGALYLTQARNTGAAFSFAEGFTVVFTLIAAVVVAVIIRTARRLFSTAWAVSLGLVLGGALGNLTDRVFRDPGFLRGGVVDFISVFGPDGSVYPIFNVADSAVVCGGILGAVLAIRGIEFDGGRAGNSGPAD